ncbi:MAG: DNA polymerase I [Candidatus Eisenbacteria bacterium]
MTGRLLLIDGSALIFRSHFAFIRAPLRTSKGEETSAVFGVASTLLRLLDERSPEYAAFVLDTAKPTFRHEMYEKYKANRPEIPPALSEQYPRILEVVDALSLPALSLEGYEADDLIATLAEQATAEGIEVEIYSGDKDFLQLVRPGIRVVIPGKEGKDALAADDAAVVERAGVPPRLVVDLMALAGDSSDNVPGVPGVGPKTAVRLITEHGSLDALYDRVASVPGKLGENLKAHRDDAYLSRDLVTIRRDVPLPVRIEELRRRPVATEKAAPLFRELELYSLLKLIGGKEERVDEVVKTYRLAASEKDLRALAEEVRRAGRFAFDTETTSIDPVRADLVGISVATAPGSAWYVPLRHAGAGNLPLERVKSALGPLFEDAALPKAAQNAKYDILVLRRAGFTVRGLSFDPMVASYLLNPEQRQHGLDHLALVHLNHKMIPIERVIGAGKTEKTMDRVRAEEAREYACEDADWTLRLADSLAPRLREAALEKLFREVEIPLVGVLARMEERGVAIDVPFLERMSADLAGEIGGMVEEIHEAAGGAFNVNSPKQLAEVLFKRLGLKPLRKTKTGFSTDIAVLQELAARHRLPALILDYRLLEKLRSTYVDALPKLVNPETGRIHTSFNQTVTATGRLSSSDPNLQNIPIRTEIGRKIRKAFVAGGEDRRILSVDYSQIELRLLAHLSGDERLIADFRAGKDIHRRTAATLFGVKEEEVTGEMRSRAKAVNFGIIYGMGAYGLAGRLGIPQGEAQDFIDGYFSAYPKVKEYLEETVARGRERGYVDTMLGRRRYLPELSSGNARIRATAERTAVNTPIQGSAADLIKLAMIAVDGELPRAGEGAYMILQVHDELVFETPESLAEKVGALAKRVMESRMELRVPLVADAGWGRNWLEAHGPGSGP